MKEAIEFCQAKHDLSVSKEFAENLCNRGQGPLFVTDLVEIPPHLQSANRHSYEYAIGQFPAKIEIPQPEISASLTAAVLPSSMATLSSSSADGSFLVSR